MYTKLIYLVATLTFSLALAACGDKDGGGGEAGGGGASLDAAITTQLVLSPANAVLSLNQDSQIKAWLVGSDGSIQEITEQVTWANANDSVASLQAIPSQFGFFRGHLAGQTSVTATYNGMTANSSVTVNPAILQSVQISPNLASIPAGVNQAFKVTGLYDDGSTADLSDQADWSCDDTSVATVSNNAGSKGRVAILRPGSANITVTVGSFSNTTAVNATSAVLQSITVNPSSPTVPAGLTSAVIVTGVYSDGTTADLTNSASWSSSDPAVVAVNYGGQNGMVKALSTGNATVTVSMSGVTAQFTVSASAATLGSIAISPNTASFPKGVSQQFYATGMLSDGTTIDLTSQISWSSTDSSVAYVNAAGVLVSVGTGSATITGTYSGVSQQFSVTVSAASLVSLSVSPANASVAKGSSQAFQVSGVYSDGSTSDLTNSVNWSSNDPAVASISNATGSAGVAVGQNVGVATIAATKGSVNASAQLHVTSATLSSLSLSAAATTIPAGTNLAVSASGVYSDGSVVSLAETAAWSVSNANATVSNSAGSRGLVHGLSSGAVVVTASVGGVSASFALTVSSANLSSIQVTPSVVSVAAGLSQQMTAVGTYTDGSTMDLTSAVTWTSSAPAKVGLSNAAGSQGYASALAAGNAMITASLGAVNGSADFTVTSAALSQIEFSPTSLTLANGLTQSVTATGIYTDGSTADVSNAVSWSTSDANVAAVSNSAGSRGRVSATGVGSATITASVGGQQAQFNVTVNSASLVSITVSAGASSLARGTSLNLTATGVYTDGSTQNLTNSVSWTSSSISILTVSNTAGSYGRVTGVNTGSVTVTANKNGVNGTINLNVTSAVLTGLAINPAGGSVAQGLSQAFTVVGTYSDSSTADLSGSASWSSDNAAVATVSMAAGSKGVVSGITQGTAMITATHSGFTAQANVSVTAAVLQAITVSHSGTTLAKGLTRQLIATGAYSDGSTMDLTTSVTWGSNDTTRVAVSNVAGAKGIAVATDSNGSATVSATLNGVTGTSTVNVGAAVLMSVAVDPNSVFVLLLGTYQLHAYAYYSDGTAVDVTNSANWVSVHPSRASVNNTTNKGLVTALTLVGTTITATYSGMSGNSAVQGIL